MSEQWWYLGVRRGVRVPLRVLVGVERGGRGAGCRSQAWNGNINIIVSKKSAQYYYLYYYFTTKESKRLGSDLMTFLLVV